MVVDAETGEYLDAKVSLTSITNSKDTVYTATTDSEDGITAKQMTSVPANLTVKRMGYIDHVAKIDGFDSDTMYIMLQPMPRNTKVILKNIFFDFDKTTIKMAESEESLQELFQLLQSNKSMRIEISGHTDNKGSDAYNDRLSEGRAKAIYDEMVKRGIAPNRMRYSGKGKREPITTNDTEEGRAENRRVEFTIL